MDDQAEIARENAEHFGDVVTRVAKALQKNAPHQYDPASDDMTVEFAIQLADRQESNRALIRQCAECVPTTWLDPLLSGPGKVAEFKEGAVGVVKLLTAVRSRILALAQDE